MSKVFRPDVYARLHDLTRAELEQIAEAALDVAYPPMFRRDGTGAVQILDQAPRRTLQALFERIVQ